MASRKHHRDPDEEEDDDRVWVQCETCNKWRALPPTVNTASLPDKWLAIKVPSFINVIIIIIIIT